MTNTKKKIIRAAVNTVLIVLGILSAGLGLKGFLLSSRFIDGGSGDHQVTFGLKPRC